MGRTARLAGLVFSTLLTSQAMAQGTQASADVVTDSAAVHAVVVAVSHHLAWAIAAGAVAKEPRPWQISVPDSTVQIWQTVKSRFYSVLHARPTSSADTVGDFVTFGAIRVRGDSLFSGITVGQVVRCGRRWVASGTSTELTSVRSNGMWLQPSDGYIEITEGFCKRGGA